VFDQSWAQFATNSLGIPYYPKLQGCVPFSPVPGPRVLLHPSVRGAGPADEDDRASVLRTAAVGLTQVCDELGISGVHLTFLTEEEAAAFEGAGVGFQRRTGIQYHFYNQRRGAAPGTKYTTFDDYLMDLKQSRRKNIRQELKSVDKAGFDLVRLSGADLGAAGWDRFFEFYLNTVDKRWGTAYLTRDFFHRLGEGPLAERVLLVGAVQRGGTGGGGGGLVLPFRDAPAAEALAAGALNLVGGQALYGRNWGCAPELDVRNLHFAVW
jgi:uncharacterized protein